METLIEYFGRVATYNGWVVAIELILIGLVVYWAVDFLEGTRGERLFRGVIFVLICFPRLGGIMLRPVFSAAPASSRAAARNRGR